jgi:hypothetical protein
LRWGTTRKRANIALLNNNNNNKFKITNFHSSFIQQQQQQHGEIDEREYMYEKEIKHRLVEQQQQQQIQNYFFNFSIFIRQHQQQPHGEIDERDYMCEKENVTIFFQRTTPHNLFQKINFHYSTNITTLINGYK